MNMCQLLVVGPINAMLYPRTAKCTIEDAGAAAWCLLEQLAGPGDRAQATAALRDGWPRSVHLGGLDDHALLTLKNRSTEMTCGPSGDDFQPPSVPFMELL